MILYSYNISPYAAKVRGILQWKGIPFQERLVHPMARGVLTKVSGQIGVPVLVDGDQVISDSTRIAAHLDAKHPEKPVIPTDPRWRAQALLLEDWADEGLPKAVQPVRWFLPANAARTVARFRAAYPAGALEDAKFVAVGIVVGRTQRKKHGPPAGPGTPEQVLARLATTLDLLEGALAETGWLAGPSPSVADFAAYGFLQFLPGLDGFDLVEGRPRVHAFITRLGEALA